MKSSVGNSLKKRGHAVYCSSDSDNDSGGDVPGTRQVGLPLLPSLETGKIVDFDRGDERDAIIITKGKKKKKKEERLKEREMQEKVLESRQKKRQLKERIQTQANKKVWIKFDRENPIFENYYRAQFQWNQNEWKDFVTKLAEAPRVYFELNQNRKSALELTEASLKCDFKNLNGRTVQVTEEEQRHVEIKSVDGVKNLWCLNMDKKALRKSKVLAPLNNFLQAQAQLGNIVRHDLTNCILTHFLQVKPNDMILDLCGGSGSAMRGASIVDNLLTSGPVAAVVEGGLVINEPESKLIASNIQVLQKNVAYPSSLLLTNHKPESFPDVATFDRVLCSAPCSGDGYIRSRPETWRCWKVSNAFKFHATQSVLIEKAVNLLRIGGLLVYCTRSFNPLENEAVVAHALRTFEGSLELVDVSTILPHLKRKNGLSQWKVFDEEMQEILSWKASTEKQRNIFRGSMWCPSDAESQRMHLNRTFRVFPHITDSHGMYIAVLRKTSERFSAPIGPSVQIVKNRTKEKSEKRNSRMVGYSPISHEDFSSIKKMFGMEKISPNRLLSRNDYSADNMIHLVTSSVAKLLSDDKVASSLHVSKIGGAVFRPFKKCSSSACRFQFVSEGMREISFSLSGKRMVAVSRMEFQEILQKKEVWLSQISSTSRAILEKFEEGGFMFCLEDDDPMQTTQMDISVSAWRGQSSVQILASTQELNRLALLMEYQDLPKDMFDDGYESMDSLTDAM